MNRSPVAFATCLLSLLPSFTQAKDLFVPSGGEPNYATIQAAIDAASDGDRIRVLPGVYVENLDFRGDDVDIQLIGSDPATTILEGDGTDSVVTFDDGETKDTVLTGFTIRNGKGTSIDGNLGGGGIYCEDSNPSIIGNIIEKNALPTALEGQQGFGGGILLINSQANVSRNVFRENAAFIGGGVFVVRGAPSITDNVFYENEAFTSGGVGAQGAARIWNNTFVRNAAEFGAHVGAFGFRPEVINNVMTHATRGGGVYLERTPEKVLSWISHNNLWANEGGDYLRSIVVDNMPSTEPLLLSGIYGNIAEDPLWMNLEQNDFRLTNGSPCINTGHQDTQRADTDFDFHNSPRLFSTRIDIGAHEFDGTVDFAPVADAGSDFRVSVINEAVTLDASASHDPEADALTYQWKQLDGDVVELTNSTSAMPQFPMAAPGHYTFELVVHDGNHASRPDTVEVIVENLPPVASAGVGRSFSRKPTQIQLDGSYSMDPEGSSLTYQWRQTAGPVTVLEPVSTPTFSPTEDGSYTFELTVTDEHGSSATDTVTYHVGLVRPIANAGLPRYSDDRDIQLDGTASADPNSSEPLVYSWKELNVSIFGSAVKMEGAGTATPTLKVLSQPKTRLKTLTFELTVSSQGLTSEPSTVEVHLVPKLGNTKLRLENGPFDPEKPTIVSFGGGNCDTGGQLSLGSRWRPHANLFSGSYSRDSGSPSDAPTYFGYGDLLVVMLSELAPHYDQPIQTIGFSTGNMPAFDAALRINTVYKDPRYAINRISMLDSGCNGVRDYQPNIEALQAALLEGELFWIDNYYSAAGQFRNGVYNVEFPTPPAEHSTPNTWYPRSWTFGAVQPDDSILGGAYFSLVGPGSHYHLNTNQADYFLGWEAAASRQFLLEELKLLSPTTTQAMLPAPVVPIGPDAGSLVSSDGALLSCEPVEGAVRYQVVVGYRPDRVSTVISESNSPPSDKLSTLSFPETYWSVRAVDASGSYAFSPPKLLLRDTDGDGLADIDEVSIYGSNPRMTDTDQDGRTDFDEAVAGTDLLFPNALTHHYQITYANDGLALHWLGQAGKRYEIEFSPDLEQATWQSVGQIQVPEDGEASTPLSYNFVRDGATRGFYRIVLRE